MKKTLTVLLDHLDRQDPQESQDLPVRTVPLDHRVRQGPMDPPGLTDRPEQPALAALPDLRVLRVGAAPLVRADPKGFRVPRVPLDLPEIQDRKMVRRVRWALRGQMAQRVLMAIPARMAILAHQDPRALKVRVDRRDPKATRDLRVFMTMMTMMMTTMMMTTKMMRGKSRHLKLSSRHALSRRTNHAT